MHCGYPEKYRVDTLNRALRIFDKMKEEDNNGTRPLYRPKDWNVVARRKEKDKKRNMTGQPGGGILPPSLSPQPQTVSLPIL